MSRCGRNISPINSTTCRDGVLDQFGAVLGFGGNAGLATSGCYMGLIQTTVISSAFAASGKHVIDCLQCRS